MAYLKVYIRGGLGYFGIASMKTTMQEWDGWLRRCYRCYIRKQWKRLITRVKGATVILAASSQTSAGKAVTHPKGKYPNETVAGISPNLASLDSVREHSERQPESMAVWIFW
ncbi:MAG: group II intron maturase-specific domain-containing protein [Faecousia sp.]